MTQIDNQDTDTPQHVTSHTEILIQEAYDRGYADACLRHDWFGEENE